MRPVTHRRPRRGRAGIAGLAALSLSAVVVGCGDDDGADRSAGDANHGPAADGTATTGGGDAGPGDPGAAPPTGAIGLDELRALAGGAPAATGAGLDEAPGPVARDLLDGFGEVAIAITAPDGTVTGWCVLVAARPEQRARGLMEVTDLGGYAGMLFVYDDDATGGYYMRNTPMPLRIGWFTAEGDLVTTRDMAPCDDVADCPTYHPDGAYRFALEVPSAEARRVGVVEGSRLAVGGACAA